MGGLALRATVVLNSTSNGASMRGFAITGSGEVVWACGATARLSRNTVFDAGDVSITASFGSDLTVTDNVIRNGWGALFCDTGTRVKARGNTFTGRNNAITIGHSSTIDGALVDLGTAADPGRNVIVGGSGGVGLFFMAQTSSIVLLHRSGGRQLLEGGRAGRGCAGPVRAQAAHRERGQDQRQQLLAEGFRGRRAAVLALPARAQAGPGVLGVYR